jgi:K+/H+ antiporter YhaU regulatory subunit KhtT
MGDKILIELSKEQRKLTARIYQHGIGKGSERNITKQNRLKKIRNKIFRKIKARRKELELDKFTEITDKIQHNSHIIQAYEATRLLRKQKVQRLRLQDEEGNEIRDVKHKLEDITKFYKDFFTRQGEEKLNPWRGDPRPLDNYITADEVGYAVRSLRNNRAVGPDNIPGELYKYGGKELIKEIANLVNSIFECHESVKQIKEGYLFALNKPGQAAKANKTRPIILLPALRKIISTVQLNRMKEAVNRYLPPGQHAYREGRSTTEVIWTMQWIKATTEKYSERAKIIGIDLSKAFDCLDRHKLLEIIETEQIANEDGMRILTYLLSETSLTAKINGDFGSKFDTTIGTPQGDALSPVLFLVYLERIMRTYSRQDIINGTKDTIVSYADDVTFILREKDTEIPDIHDDNCTCADCRAEILKQTLPEHFSTMEMKMNTEKTTIAEVKPKACTIGKTLGCYINGEEEIALRKSKAASAFNSLQKLWNTKDGVNVEMKMKMYNGLIRPYYTYSIAAIALKNNEKEKLDSHHRAQLRRLLGIFYPRKISNDRLYKRTKTKPISIEITRARWSLLGHILRRATQNIPAYNTMRQYFQRKESQIEQARVKTRRGRLLTTIPRLIQLDILRIKKPKERRELLGTDNFNSGTNLSLLKKKAENRNKWKEIVDIMARYEELTWINRNKERKRLQNERRAINQENNTAQGRGRGRPRGSGRGRGRQGRRNRNTPNLQTVMDSFKKTLDLK